MEAYLKDNFLVYPLGLFFILAGLYHFINPGFYLGLIPTYIPWPVGVNILVGILELVLGVLVCVSTYRKLAAYGILLLLLFLIPSHIYFINLGSCVPDSLCVSPWISWFRLVFIHPLLMFWAWKSAPR